MHTHTYTHTYTHTHARTNTQHTYTFQVSFTVVCTSFQNLVHDLSYNYLSLTLKIQLFTSQLLCAVYSFTYIPSLSTTPIPCSSFLCVYYPPPPRTTPSPFPLPYSQYPSHLPLRSRSVVPNFREMLFPPSILIARFECPLSCRSHDNVYM